MFRFSLLLGALSLAAVAAQAGQECSTYDISGHYKGQHLHQDVEVKIEQKGCSVFVRDLGNGAQWWFDLTGKDLASVPKPVLDAQTSTLGFETLRSLQIRTKAGDGDYVSRILLEGTMNAPRTKENAYNVDIQLKAHMDFTNAMVSYFPNGRIRLIKFGGLSLGGLQARVVNVADGSMFGLLKDGFLKGVNYVLALGDGILDPVMGFAQLTKVE